MTTIGQRIKQRRSELGLSQVKLSEKVGIDRSLISHLEGDKWTGTSHVAALAYALKVNALWLQTGRGKPDIDYVPPAEITYPKEIEEVIRLMEATDDRGREKALIAVKDALDAHRAWKNSLPRVQDVDELGELSSRLVRDLLPESAESENASNDVYRTENVGVRKGTRH